MARPLRPARGLPERGLWRLLPGRETVERFLIQFDERLAFRRKGENGASRYLQYVQIPHILSMVNHQQARDLS